MARSHRLRLSESAAYCADRPAAHDGWRGDETGDANSAASRGDKLQILEEQALGMLHRRAFLHLSALAVAQLAFQRVVGAQGYPDRPITLVVPFPAGGPTDVIARIFAERLRQALGQAVIVENVAGAGATLGRGRVFWCPPEGL